MLIPNGNERLTVPAEAGGGQLCKTGRTLHGTCPVLASNLPGRPSAFATFPSWGSGLLPLLPISMTFLCRPAALNVVDQGVRAVTLTSNALLSWGHGARKRAAQGGRAGVKGTTEGRHYKEITRLSMEFFFPLQTDKMQTTGALLIPPALVSCGSGVLCSAINV